MRVHTTLASITATLGLLMSCLPASSPYGGSFVEPAVTLTESKNAVGMNVWFLNDWDGSRAFVDAMKHARDWEAPDGTVPSTDTFGWPTQDASVILLANAVPALDNGVYHLVFEGQADVAVQWTGGTVTNQVYTAGTNTTTADVTISCNKDDTFKLAFTKTKLTAASATNTGVKAVRLFRPGYPVEGSPVFTAPLVNALKGSGIVRTMDWVATNANTVVSWSQRSTPLDAAQNRAGPDYVGTSISLLRKTPARETAETPNLYDLKRGVAIEHLIQLANETGCDLWFNIPALADDEYVRQAARMIQYGSDGTNPYTSVQAAPVYPPLAPGLHVYVEYANETWNSSGGFLCFRILTDKVVGAPAGHPVFSDNNPAETSFQYSDVWQYTAWRLAEISKVLRAEFPSVMMTRFRPVLSTQLGDAQATLSSDLLWADQYYRVRNNTPLTDLFYGAGGSGYYGVTTVTSDINALLARTNYPDKAFLRNNAIDSTWAYAYGLKRVAYEGGFGLDFPGPSNGYLFTKAQQWAIAEDPRTQDLMLKTHIAWSQTGGDDLVYYVLTGPESWGFTQTLADQNTSKMLAYRSLIAGKKAAVTLGGALPGTHKIADLYPGFQDMVRSGGYTASSSGGLVPDHLAGLKKGNMVALPLHSGKGLASAQLILSANGYTGNGSLTIVRVWINGKDQGTVTIPDDQPAAETAPLAISVPPGLAVFRFDIEAGEARLYGLTVSEQTPGV